jgi:hypothetical protein
MIFYHRTTEENWKKIREEGVLWGIEFYPGGRQRYRYTYLSPEDAGESYGQVLLEVNYEPKREDFGIKHNYGFDPPPGEYCWQFSVFEPIDIRSIKRIK